MEETIRPITRSDIPKVLGMMRALADHDGFGDLVVATPDQLENAFFNESPKVFAHVATINNEIVGYTIWYITFAGWFAKYGIWLLEVYVEPLHRRKGVGKALINQLKLICEELDYTGIGWKSTKQNHSAHAFYQSLGAKTQDSDVLFALSTSRN